MISFWVSSEEGIQFEIVPNFLIRSLFYKGLTWKLRIKKEDNKKLLFSYIFVAQRCKIKVLRGQDNDEEDMGGGRFWKIMGIK